MLIKMKNEKEQPGDHLDGRNTRNYRYGFHMTYKGKIFGCEKCIYGSGVHSCSLKEDPAPTMEEEANEFQKNFFDPNSKPIEMGSTGPSF